MHERKGKTQSYTLHMTQHFRSLPSCLAACGDGCTEHEHARPFAPTVRQNEHGQTVTLDTFLLVLVNYLPRSMRALKGHIIMEQKKLRWQ
jgi:hypothetical protein